MQSWLREIDRARTEAEVIATTRDYIALWSPAELCEFPEDCRTIRFDSQADIPRWRDKLLRGLAHMPEHSPRADDLVKLVARASDRLGELGPKA